MIMKPRGRILFGLVLVAVGVIWSVATFYVLGPCIVLPASCPPPSAEASQALQIIGLYVYVLGFFCSIPLTLVGVTIVVWGSVRR